MKMTLLAMVQEIMQDSEGDNINSINDTDESEQVADIIRQTYFNLISEKVFPEHKELSTLDASGDNTKPTHLRLPSDVDTIYRLEYNVATENGDVQFKELVWKEPLDFLDMTKTRDASDSTNTIVTDFSGVSIVIRNNKAPSYYTSFDDDYIVCDSYNSTVDSTLQSSKTRAYVSKEPVFNMEDTFIPDLNSNKFRLLVSEAKSLALATIPKTVNPKVEQIARKQRTRTQNDSRRTRKLENRNGGFGRT